MMRHSPADPRAVRRNPDTAPFGAPFPSTGGRKRRSTGGSPRPSKQPGPIPHALFLSALSIDVRAARDAIDPDEPPPYPLADRVAIKNITGRVLRVEITHVA